MLVNVWNWDPRWKVKVTENGKDLPIEWKGIEDPLHTFSYDAPRTVLKDLYYDIFSQVLVTEQNDVAINSISMDYINNRIK